jgi:hypothetical protein
MRIDVEHIVESIHRSNAETPMGARCIGYQIVGKNLHRTVCAYCA